ncbi:MAG: hypothetical protein IPK16_23415 [Anaerolineales bacterium]|nr:hypothetical protein [Anaerolineales bacterium]
MVERSDPMRRLVGLVMLVVILLAGIPVSAAAVVVAPLAQDPVAPAPPTADAASLEVQEVLAIATAVAAGGAHTCALTTVGGVLCWGENGAGQLGDSTTVDRWTPVAVTGLASGVQSIAAGANHSCAVTATGGVKCWGDNAFGQLGDGSKTDRRAPVDVVGLTGGVRSVAAGGGAVGEHTCAVTSANGMKCWGDNAYGQLGDSTRTDRLTPVDVSGLASGVRNVAMGELHTCAVTTTGRAVLGRQ